ncbi:MAG: lysoplasmalogenase [Bacteroidota bacterium]|nr:lysoplasmalogenase [Bacteroidota bacterium]
MKRFIHTKFLWLFWLDLLIHCVFQHYQLIYVAITKPLLVPLLMTFLFLNDEYIGSPVGKVLFYIGLFLAFFGDILLILINDTFFLSGMIAFMLMNVSYSISLTYIQPLQLKRWLPLSLTALVLALVAYTFHQMMKDELGQYAMPVNLYMVTVAIMVLLAVNVVFNKEKRKIALQYLIPGVLIFLVENVLVAVNKFHFDHQKDIFALVMFLYGLAQFLLVMGFAKIYLKVRSFPVPE